MLKKNIKTKNYTFEFDYESPISKKFGHNHTRKKDIIVTKKNDEGNYYFPLNMKLLIISKVLNQIKEKYGLKETINRPFILNLLYLNKTSYSVTFTTFYKNGFLELKKEGNKQNIILGEQSVILFNLINRNLEIKKLYLDYKQKIESLYNKETKEFKNFIDKEIEMETRKLNKKPVPIFESSISLN